MIFKPAELTPLSALKLAEIYTEAGLPDGVFNVVQGFAETGQALTRHPGIAKVSLTGEVGTGKRSEEHTSELQSLMRISYAVFCLKKKKKPNHTTHTSIQHPKTHS